MNRVSMVLACAAMLFAVQPAAATEDVSSEIAEMRELVQGLKQKVDAQEEQLEHQGQLLEQAQERARVQQEEDAKSGLSTFLDAVEVGGHVAVSYNYNLKDPHNRVEPDNGPFSDISGGYGSNQGVDGAFLPFHQDHNAITVDQVVFNISKPATEESRAGFGFEVLLGQNANFLGQGGQVNNNGDLQSRRSHNLDGTSDYYISQAYLEYQCGCLGPEVTFTAGKFMTMVGAEVFQSPGNFNITRGNVYAFLQPVDHVGLLASADLGPTNLTLGVVNSGASFASAPDFNNEKSYLASLFVGDDRLNVRTSFIYGAEGDFDFDQLDSQRSGLADVTAWFNPTESLSLWANYNYLYMEGTAAYAHGVAVAGRLQVLEKLGAAVRGEFIKQSAGGAGGNDSSTFIPLIDDNIGEEIWSATATLDYALTDHLTTRIESRWDWIDQRSGGGQGFFESRNGFDDNQVVLLAEAIYEF